MGKQNNSQPKNLYQMSISKSRAIDMVDALTRSYMKDSTTAHMDSFITSFFKQLDDWQVPWMDLPFYINSLAAGNFPKELKEIFTKRSLVGKPTLPDEERAKQSIEYFTKNKLNIIQRYMDLLTIYLCTKRLNVKILSLRNAAALFDLSEDQMQELLNSKNIPLYDVLGQLRVKESDLALLLTTCRTKKSVGLRSDVTFDESNTQETKPEKSVNRSKESQSRNPAPAKSQENASRKEPQLFVADKGTNIAEDDVNIGFDLLKPNATDEPTKPETSAVIIPTSEEPAAEPPVDNETDNTSDVDDVEITALANVASDADDPLNLFSAQPLPSTEEDPLEEFEVGDNMFREETGEPPSGLSYRNRE